MVLDVVAELLDGGGDVEERPTRRPQLDGIHLPQRDVAFGTSGHGDDDLREVVVLAGYKEPLDLPLGMHLLPDLQGTVN